jgi:MFS transporter, ACS family, D-galactonate transporter
MIALPRLRNASPVCTQRVQLGGFAVMNLSSSREAPVSFDRPAPPAAHQAHPGMNRVLLLLTVSVLINYIDRSNLSIAAPLLKDELHISNTQLGALLAAFFWTYGLMQIPAGWLVDRFDVKWVFAAGFFIWSTATAATGLLHGFAALIAVRIILGVGESVAFPSYSNILGTYFPEARRGFPNALLMAGLSLGPAVGILVGGTAVGRFGWRPFFLALGLGALVWLAPWVAWMPRKASSLVSTAHQAIGIPSILRQRSAWGTCLGQFCVNYFLYFLVTWLPSYLKRGRGFSMDDVAKYGGLLFLMSAISATVWGKLSDQWIKTGSTPTHVRKGALVLGQVGIGVALVFTALTHGRLFVAMLAVTGIFLGIGCCSTWAVTQTLAGPHAAGRWAGVQNFIGNMAGWVAPMLTGILLDRTGQFYWPFFITAAIAWIGAASWGWVVGPVEPVDWSRVPLRSEILPVPAAEAPLP